MIALVDDLPLVEFSEGSVFAFRQEWLRCNLLKAATAAGYPNWWLADHVTQSVTCYLLSQFSAPVMLATRLEETVQSVLKAIGYGEIGEHFSAIRPVTERSLLQVAQLSEGYELAFFNEIKAMILQELGSGAKTLHLSNLAASAKFLKGSKNFTSDCAQLRDEIVSHISKCVHLHAGDKTVSIILR